MHFTFLGKSITKRVLQLTNAWSHCIRISSNSAKLTADSAGAAVDIASAGVAIHQVDHDIYP